MAQLKPHTDGADAPPVRPDEQAEPARQGQRTADRQIERMDEAFHEPKIQIRQHQVALASGHAPGIDRKPDRIDGVLSQGRHRAQDGLDRHVCRGGPCDHLDHALIERTRLTHEVDLGRGLTAAQVSPGQVDASEPAECGRRYQSKAFVEVAPGLAASGAQTGIGEHGRGRFRASGAAAIREEIDSMFHADRIAVIEDGADLDRVVTRGEAAAHLDFRLRRAGKERLQVGSERCLDSCRQMRHARARRKPREDDLDQLLASPVEQRLRSARSLAGEASQLGILNDRHHRGDGVLAS